MRKIKINGKVQTISGPTRERNGWTWFYVVKGGYHVSEQSVPTWWFNEPAGKITTGGNFYSPA